MAFPKLNVRDNVAWGELNTTWATGSNYVDHVATERDPVPTEVEASPRYPKPASFSEFVAQATRAEAGLFFGDDGDGSPVRGDEPVGFVLL